MNGFVVRLGVARTPCDEGNEVKVATREGLMSGEGKKEEVVAAGAVVVVVVRARATPSLAVVVEVCGRLSAAQSTLPPGHSATVTSCSAA